MRRLAWVLLTAIVTFGQGAAPNVNHDLGYDDTPMLPGLPFHVHDPLRPHPPMVTPAAQSGCGTREALNRSRLCKGTAVTSIAWH